MPVGPCWFSVTFAPARSQAPLNFEHLTYCGSCGSLSNLEKKVGALPVFSDKDYWSHSIQCHLFPCMLAYYIQWHTHQRLAPVLFVEENTVAARALRKSMVAPG